MSVLTTSLSSPSQIPQPNPYGELSSGSNPRRTQSIGAAATTMFLSLKVEYLSQ